MLRGLRHMLGARPPLSSSLFPLPPTPLLPLPFFPLFFVFLMFSLRFLSVFSLFFSIFLLPSLFLLFPPLRTLEVQWGPHGAPAELLGARPPETRGLRPVPFVPLRGSGTANSRTQPHKAGRNLKLEREGTKQTCDMILSYQYLGTSCRLRP